MKLVVGERYLISYKSAKAYNGDYYYHDAKFKGTIKEIRDGCVQFLGKREDVIYDKGKYRVLSFINGQYKMSWLQDDFIQYGKPLFDGPTVNVGKTKCELSKLKQLLS